MYIFNESVYTRPLREARNGTGPPWESHWSSFHDKRLSTEGRVVGLCWAKSKPKGPKADMPASGQTGPPQGRPATGGESFLCCSGGTRPSGAPGVARRRSGPTEREVLSLTPERRNGLRSRARCASFGQERAVAHGAQRSSRSCASPGRSGTSKKTHPPRTLP